MINGALLHLSLNHIPVVGFPLCFLFLAIGLWKKSKDLIQAALGITVLIALITVPAWKSGGPAAHTLFHYPNVNVERMTIHAHAEAGEKGFFGALVVGAIALLGWGLSMRPEGAPTLLAVLALLGTLALSVWFANVAHLGGLIRHPEIATAPTE
jgi:hypothetical protein